MTVDALRTIKHCSIALIGFVAGAVGFIIMFGDNEDRPAGVFMSFLVTLASSIIGIVAAMFARNLKNSLRQSEGQPGLS